jgi:MFS family permease
VLPGLDSPLYWKPYLESRELRLPLAVRRTADDLSAPQLRDSPHHIGRRRLLVAGYAIYGLLYLLIGQLQSGSLWLYPLFAGYGLFLSATEGVKKALVADLALPGERGTAFGWFNLITGLALLPASLLFGGLMQSYGAPVAFAVAAIFALLAAGLLAVMPLGRHHCGESVFAGS